MRNRQQYPDDNGYLYPNLQRCNCCPYGYHIDLDFIQYCESLANWKPSKEQLLRRDKRRSRKSLEVMLGLEDFYQWQPTEKVHPVKEVQNEYEPDSPRVIAAVPHRNARDIFSDFPSCFPYDESPTAGLALKSAAASPASTHSAHSTIEATAFVRDALDEVVSDFERTLERNALVILVC